MLLVSFCNGNCDLIKNSLIFFIFKKNFLVMVSIKNRLWFNFFNFIKKLLIVYCVKIKLFLISNIY